MILCCLLPTLECIQKFRFDEEQEMEQEVRPLSLDTNTIIISLLFSSNLLNIEIFEEVDLVPNVGDLFHLLTELGFSSHEYITYLMLVTKWSKLNIQE